ncbi:Fanconi anemia group A protein isoform X2 [Ascaphus truei]|uniref:Fanconi anemia group A protein isoform X2 n=1 Tax=Ascaphus truei TaxID=8439 RepID=UPI003F5AC6EE
MSTVSDSATGGGQKRSLSELLGGRAKRPERKSEGSTTKLQEATLYLLSCHQDPSGFLSEVDAPPYKKTLCISETSDSSNSQAVHTESFIGSALRDQALRLGLPAGILTARATVSNIQQICQDSTGGAVLSEEQRDKLSCLLKTLKGLLVENCFCRSVFSKEIWKAQCPLVLEAVWHLHNEGIVGLQELLESCTDPGSAAGWFCREMCSLCQHMENSSAVPQLPEQIISDFLTVLIRSGFRQSSDPGRMSEQPRIAEITLSVLDKMLSWFLSAVSEETCEQACKPRHERHWLIVFEVSRYRARVTPESLESFFVHTLTTTLTYRPQLKVSDAIRLQRNWSFVKTCRLLTDLYRKLFVAFSAEKLAAHLQLVLETQEVNWRHVLTCVSCLVICQSEAQQLVKDLLSRLLTQAFERYELECLITAFLIARQAALEGPAAFVPYTEWFKCTFGAAGAYQNTSKKSLVFLLKFLADLVPFEAPQYLKVHILFPPFVPTKYRPLLMDYITLAKTRLSDMKVSIEDMGLYEDLSAGTDKPQSQARQDVEKAVRIFENTGKIPASVMEASIFRRPYFTSRFLPALLAPRVLPAAPDSHMRLVDSLKRADKIPGNMFSVYLAACEQEKHRKQEGREREDPALKDEPLGRLRSALWDLRPLITDPKQYDEVSAQVAVISDRLMAVMGSDEAESPPVIPESLIPTAGTELELRDQTVADLLLTCFCQCIMAASCSNPPDRQGHWPSLYVKMLCGHHWAFSAVLSRTLQLLCHQAPLLSDSHVVGLAAFSVHLHECQTSLPAPSCGGLALATFWEALLNPRSADSMSVCLRFCTAAVGYAFCRFSLSAPGAALSCLPPLFLRKLQHLLPRLVRETRGEVISEGEMDAQLPWRSLSLPSPGWKEAALGLWSQSRLQEVLSEQPFQLSFRDWLLWEMSLHPDKDALCDTERQDYQRWAVNHRYVPESSAAGGCEGDTERACVVMVDAVLEFCSRSERSSRSYEWNAFPSHSRTGLADILCCLQELVWDLVAGGYPPSGRPGHSHFLFGVFRQRLEGAAGSTELSSRLTRQGEVGVCSRVLMGLPPSLLIATHCDKGVTTLRSGDFFSFVNEELKNFGVRGCALPYNITAHFFRGLLSASAQCEDPDAGVNSVLTAALSTCPIILISAALWWPQLNPVLSCHWDRLFGGPLPRELEVLRELQAAVDSCLSHGGSPLPLSGTDWLSAAFTFFTVRRKRACREILAEFLAGLGPQAEELLVSLLFFSVMDLLPSLLKEGTVHNVALENCLQIIHCLEERGDFWVSLFQLTEGVPEPGLLLHRTASEQFLNLLPLAFYSLVPSLHMERLTQQQNFLAVAVQMYIKLVHLFLDGSHSADSSLDSQHLDSQELLTRSRQFLLRCVPKSPKPSSALRSQLLHLCGECDPELTAALQDSHRALHDDDLYNEPNLF